MPGMMKKAMLYLGLGSDEDFQSMDQGSYGDTHAADGPGAHQELDEIYLDDPNSYGAQGHAGHQVGGQQHQSLGQPVQQSGGVRTLSPTAGRFNPTAPPQTAVRMLDPTDMPQPTERGTPSLVRTLPPTSKISPVVVSPDSFDDAQEVGDHFRAGKPVVMNLQSLNTDLSRRLMDFTSGLCYAKRGRMKKVGPRVYLLTPSDVDVSPAEEDRLRDAGLYD